MKERAGWNTPGRTRQKEEEGLLLAGLRGPREFAARNVRVHKAKDKRAGQTLQDGGGLASGDGELTVCALIAVLGKVKIVSAGK